MSITVSAIQFEPEFKNKERNIREIEKLIRQAAGEGAKLIVAPEMATTGYIWEDAEEVKPYAEPIPGPTTNLMCDLSYELDTYIVISFPELDEKLGICYNTAILVGPKGFIGKYRKVQPYAAEPLWAKNGDEGFKVFDTEIGKIGLAICMDMTFIEPSRILELKGCDIICSPVNWFGEITPAQLWITRAFETGCSVIVSNRWKSERKTDFAGGSTIIDWEGNILASKDRGDGFVLADLDMDAYRTAKAKRESRIKHPFYNDLSRSTHQWNPIHFFAQACDTYPEGDIFYGSAMQTKVLEEPDLDQKLKNTLEIVNQECAKGSRLIVLPELYLSGRIKSCDEAKEQAIISNEVNSKFGDLIDACKENDAYIIIGGIEEKEEKLYNTAWLIGPDCVLGSYHKNHLNEKDKIWAKPGQDLFVHDLPIGRIGIIIGGELELPEFARVNAIRGVEVLAIPADIKNGYGRDYNLTDSNRKIYWHLARVRAVENNLYTMFANYTGGESLGRSGIFGSDATSIKEDQNVMEAQAGIGSAYHKINTKNDHPEYPVNRVKAKQLLSLREPYWYSDLWS